MRNAGVAAAVMTTIGVTGLQAETLHYYYVSGPAIIANQERAEHRPLMNIGRLTIDTGESLAGRTVSYTHSWEEYEGHDGIDLSFDFSLGLGGENVSYRLIFDESENLSTWDISSDWNHTFSEMELFSVSNAGSSYRKIYTEWPPFENQMAEQVLSERGYSAETAAYHALFCGSWAGEHGGCEEDGIASSAWAMSFLASGGMWIKDDLGAFANLIQATAVSALANPPRSYHDIQAVPLPAPLALLLGGVAALVLVRRSALSG